MRKLFSLILRKVVKASTFVLKPGLFQNLELLRNRIYSLWVSSFFKNPHSSFLIEYPGIFKGHKYMEFGKNFSARGQLRIEMIDTFLDQTFKPELIVGENVCFNYNCHIGCVEKIVIGNNVLVGSNVLITDHFHGNSESETLDVVPSQRPLVTKGVVVIEEDVWIGENVSIMPGVRIGKGSVVGANSVVTKSFPEKSIIGGIPAKKIK